jgi:hypothetical protein
MDELAVTAACQPPLTPGQLPTMVFGKLEPVAVLSARNSAGGVRLGRGRTPCEGRSRLPGRPVRRSEQRTGIRTQVAFRTRNYGSTSGR